MKKINEGLFQRFEVTTVG
ncbi:hypothetical protein D047_2706A, partial [Vibrio parahaemolyticus VPTS-2010_2]